MHQLKGDLDWIVMKCLEKDRTRRYETANGLAADLKRHLNNEPVVARPPSTAYRFQKAIRRNKIAFAAGAVVIGALLLGIIATTWQSVRATHAKQEALAAQAQAEASGSLAVRPTRLDSASKPMPPASQAEDLVFFMIQDLQPALKDYGRLSLLKQVDEKTVSYFAALPPGLRNDTELGAGRCGEALAEIFQIVGRHEIRLGNRDEALDLYQRWRGSIPKFRRRRPAR